MLRVEPKQKYEYYSVRKGDKSSEPERKPHDQAPSAILELVDGPKDTRFAMVARTVARQRGLGNNHLNSLTALNVRKVTAFRKGGVEALEEAISKLKLQKDIPAKEEVEGGARQSLPNDKSKELQN